MSQTQHYKTLNCVGQRLKRAMNVLLEHPSSTSQHSTTQSVHNRTRAHQKHASLTHHPDSPHIPIHNTLTCPKERETMAESARDSKALPQHHAHLPITPISPLHKRTPQHTQPTRSNSTHKRSASPSRVSVLSRKERCVENGGERSSKNIFRKGKCAIYWGKMFKHKNFPRRAFFIQNSSWAHLGRGKAARNDQR